MTLAAYPLVPKTEVGFRIQVTAANSQAEIEQLVDVIGKLAARLRPPARAAERVRGMSTLGSVNWRKRLWIAYLGLVGAADRRPTCGSRRSRATDR